MCGIAGILGHSDKSIVSRMLSVMHHRGPDDLQTVDRNDFTLGAVRLSIVDIEGGKQPLCDETGTIWAAQNGEIYNFPELRKRLLSQGHKLVTRCDTEVIPHLYQRHGQDFVHEIDGMFAISIFDEKEKIGILARDRMGKKPLYYFEQNQRLYFASEIKALLTIPGFHRRINLEALDAYLSYKHIPHPISIFEGVHSLPPAHKLIFRLGEPIQVSRYWSPHFVEDLEKSAQPEDELVQGLLDLLKSGVEKRLMSDVPVGFFLSGGIDSSLTTALAAESATQPIKTFTLTYGEKATTEGKEQDRKWSKWVAQKYKTEHHEESLEVRDFPENILKILRCFDEPFCGTTSTYFLSSLIAKHVKVAVSGDGADELFGSYLSHRLASPIANLKKFDTTGELNLIRPFENDLNYLREISENTQPEWRNKLFVYSEAEKKSLLSSALDTSGFKSIPQKMDLEFAQLQSKQPLNRILEWEFNSFLPDQVLTYVDRLSMAHSLEVRSAFLDTAVVNYVTPLSSDLKIRNGETKYLLKKAALKYFPEEMVFRGKEGFVLPVNRWVYDSMEKYARDILSESNLNRHGLFDVGAVSKLIDQLYKSEKQPHHTEINKLLSLIMFQEWYGLYMS